MTHNSPYAVVCRQVVKDFGTGDARVQALRGVDVDIRYGEMTLLVGPSGCGKTTLICIMAGLLDATSGEVEILGRNRSNLKGSQLVRFRAENIGFVFQQYNLLPSLSAVENAAVPLIIRGFRRSEAIARARLMMDEVGLSDRMHALPSQLSGGQQQRVAIARALVNEPSLLLADEPTGNLDTTTSHEVMEVFAQLRAERGITIVVITHERDIAAWGTRTIDFKDGVVVQDQQHQPTMGSRAAAAV